MEEPTGHHRTATIMAPENTAVAQRRSRTRNTWFRYASFLVLLAVISAVAGFQFAHVRNALDQWRSTAPAYSSSALAPALVSESRPNATNMDAEEIGHLAPQQQAERLLDLAIKRHESSLDLINQKLESWRGHLENTGHLFNLVLSALKSDDPRVRTAAVEIDLEASNLNKSPQSVTRLLKQIQNDPHSRYLALWRLGALGNRGVEPATVLSNLLRYSHDANQQTRFWAVEGLAMLGTEESIDSLLSILAHDPAQQVRERAATGLARSGLLTGEQRLTAVPQLLNLLDDDSLDPETLGLVYSTLRAITGASFGQDPDAWREWWAHHDAPEKRTHMPPGLSVT
jgi:HEAT repeat protein